MRLLPSSSWTYQFARLPLKTPRSSSVCTDKSSTHLRLLGDQSDFRFNAHIYRRDGFGHKPAFSGVVSVLNGELVGYLLYTLAYDTDRAVPYLFVIDLMVDEQLRGQGIGKALMGRAASICQAVGGDELFWAVYERNRLAMDFYKRLGAEEAADLRFMTLRV